MLSKILNICLIAIALMLVNSYPAVADDSGSAIFTAHCVGCHVNGGNIIRRGKNLKMKALKRNQLDSTEAIVSLVTNGKGVMPAYSDRLSTAEITAVSNYVLEQAANDWH